MAPAPQWVTKDFLKHIIKRAIHREISISDDEIIDYISEKRNHKIKSTTWIVYVNDKINKEPEASSKLKNKAAHRAHGRDQARKRAKFTSGEE